MTRQSSTGAMRDIHLTLPRELAEWLEREAARRFMSRGGLLAQLVAAERDRTFTPGQLPLIGSKRDESGR